MKGRKYSYFYKCFNAQSNIWHVFFKKKQQKTKVLAARVAIDQNVSCMRATAEFAARFTKSSLSNSVALAWVHSQYCCYYTVFNCTPPSGYLLIRLNLNDLLYCTEKNTRLDLLHQRLKFFQLHSTRVFLRNGVSHIAALVSSGGYEALHGSRGAGGSH